MGLFSRKKKDVAIAKDPRTLDYVLNHLGYGGPTDVRAAVAANPTIQHRLMNHLAQDDEVSVRIAAASNPRKMTPQSWKRLSEDKDEAVRAKLLEVWPDGIDEILHGSGMSDKNAREKLRGRK